MPSMHNNVNFNKNQALNMLLQMISGNHGTPVEGIIWYDSSGKVIKYYDGTDTITLGAAGGGGDADTLDGQDSTYYLARTNHTGTQAASTISDLASVVKAYTLDEFADPAADINLNSHKIVNLTNGSSAGDAVNLGQLQAAVAGLAPKDSVRVATTANVTLATGLENGDTVDGVTLATGDRVLVKSQTAPEENGIYVVAASGAPSRSTDADSSDDIRGALVSVEEGTANGNSLWMMTTDAPITIGTTGLTWTQFLSGIAYTWGGGIGISGSTVSITAGTGLTQDTDGLSLTVPVTVANGGTNATTAAGAKTNLGFTTKYTASIGNGSSTTITVTHNLGTTAVVVMVTRSGDQIFPDIDVTDGNNVDVVYTVAPTSSQDVVTVIG